MIHTLPLSHVHTFPSFYIKKAKHTIPFSDTHPSAIKFFFFIFSFSPVLSLWKSVKDKVKDSSQAADIHTVLNN
jgi:hypothetical protein